MTSPFETIDDLWRRAGVSRATLERLAAADTFRSMGLDRRQALWEVRALSDAKPLPLFEYAKAQRNRLRSGGPRCRRNGHSPNMW